MKMVILMMLAVILGFDGLFLFTLNCLDKKNA